MKTLIPALALALCLTGCATMEENRAANAALITEVNTLGTAQAERVKTARPILIIGHNVTFPNSAGGVGLTLAFQNTSGKPIKYIRFTFTAINRVGDPAPSSIDGQSTIVLNATGPFPPEYTTDSFGLRWDAAWYNNTISFARLDRVNVDFMDGTTQTIEADALAALQLRPENNVFASGVQQTRRVYVSAGKLGVERLDLN